MQVCYVAVNCVGDLCRALQLELKPFSDEIMVILLEILGVCSLYQPYAIYYHTFGYWYITCV